MRNKITAIIMVLVMLVPLVPMSVAPVQASTATALVGLNLPDTFDINADLSARTPHYRVYFPPVISAPVRFQVSDKYVIYRAQNTNSVSGAISGTQITFVNAWDNVDLNYTVENLKLKQDIILKTNTGQNTFKFQMQVAGVTASVDADGSIGFYDASGEKVFYIPKPYMYDSNTNGLICEEVSLSIEQVGANFFIIITADSTWLNDPSRVYPIVIDPTTTAFSDTFDDTTKIEGLINGAVYRGTIKLFGLEWHYNTSIKSGLTDIGDYSKPAVFEKDGIWYQIIGTYTGGFYGYNWTGSAWQSDTAIVSGLTDVGAISDPTVFYMDGVWHLISGEDGGGFYGFNWTGSAWQVDNAIVSGLTLGAGKYDSSPTVFNMSGIHYLISGEQATSGYFGFEWTGSAWQVNNTIVGGSGYVGYMTNPDVFEKDEVLYMLTGEQYGTFFGNNWTGSAWQNDEAIRYNLGDVGDRTAPDIFNMSGIWYAICGDWLGQFTGFKWLSSYSSPGTLTSITDTTTTGGNILNTTATIIDSTPTNTAIAYSVSFDDGTTWTSITDGQTVTSAGVGNDFKWKAVLTTTDDQVTPTISSVSFEIVSNALPTAPDLNSPTNETRTIGNSQILNASSTDADGDAITYHFYGDTADGSTYLGSNSSGGLYTWSTTDGQTYYWKVKAEDDIGNGSFSSIYQFTENTAPAGSLTSDSSVYTAGTQAQFTATFTDAEGDELTYRFSPDNGSSWSGWQSTNTWTYTFYGVGDVIVAVEVGDVSNSTYETTIKRLSIYIQEGAGGGGAGGGAGGVVDGYTEPVYYPDEEPRHPMFSWLVFLFMAMIGTWLLDAKKLTIILFVFFVYLYVKGVGMV